MVTSTAAGAITTAPTTEATTTTTVPRTWTNLDPAGAVPPARVDHAMVYDSRSGKVILFGGADNDDVNLNDTWSF